MYNIGQSALYFKELYLYRHFLKDAFWFQKNKGLHWVKGQNFGDYLSTVVVSESAKKFGAKSLSLPNMKLLSIGSVMHFAKDCDVIWGSGVNGKVDKSLYKFTALDVRAVRGPLTKKFLEDRKIACPEIYGDPALLMPVFFPNFEKSIVKDKIIAIPNLNEYNACKLITPKHVKLVSPLLHWTYILEEILSSELVLTSSLHGLIIAEAFGIDVKLFRPFGGETMHKYEDYIEGTGRLMPVIEDDFLSGVNEDRGNGLAQMDFDYVPLLDAFPSEFLA
jgi:pyruvyltransferase